MKKAEHIDEATKLISDKQVAREKAEGELKLIKEQINSINKNSEANSERLKQAEIKLGETLKENEGIEFKSKSLEEKEQQLSKEDVLLKDKLNEKISLKAGLFFTVDLSYLYIYHRP